MMVRLKCIHTADGTIVPCYIAADSVQTPLEGICLQHYHMSVILRVDI